MKSARARKDRAPSPSLDGGERPAPKRRSRAVPADDPSTARPTKGRRNTGRVAAPAPQPSEPMPGVETQALRTLTPDAAERLASYPTIRTGKLRSAHVLYRAFTHRAETYQAIDDALILRSRFDDLEVAAGACVLAFVGLLLAIRLAVGA